MKFEELLLHNFFLSFEAIVVVYYWLERKVFIQEKSAVILYLITFYSLIDIVLDSYMRFDNSIQKYGQFIMTVSHLLVTAYVVMWYYYRLLKNQPQKSIQLYLMFFFTLGLAYFVGIKKLNLLDFQIDIYLFVLLVIFFSITNFFLNFINHKELIRTFEYLPFWISIGLFIIYVGIVPIVFLSSQVPRIMFQIVYYSVLVLGNVVLIIGINIIRHQNAARI